MSPRSGATATDLPALIGQALREEGITGAVWAVVHPEGYTSGAAGLSNAVTNTPMTEDQRVQVGSVGKVVLAIGILRLVTEEHLSLETPVAEILPQVALDNPWNASDPVRVKHLLAHTAGLEHSRFWQVFSLSPKPDTPLVAAVTGDPTLRHVQTRPGSRYAYSNIGYALLGMVIESVTQQRYEAFLDEQVLKPLGMDSSTFHFVTQSGPHADTRLAMGHFENGAAQPAIPTYLRAAGQFTTTAADMARFSQFLLGHGAIDGRPFVAPDLMAALGEPRDTDAALAGLPIGHGLALVGRDRHGAYGWCHPGTTYGFVAMLCVFRDSGKAFFIGTNTDSETADYDRLNRLLIGALGPAPLPEAATAAAPTDVQLWEGLYVATPKAMSRLAWIDDALNAVRVRWDGRQLHIQPMQSKTRILDPVGGYRFRAPGRSGASHVLLLSPEGTPQFSDGLRTYERVPLLYIAARWLSMAAGLLGLCGIVVTGVARALMRRLRRSDPSFLPLLGTLSLLIPVPLFAAQSFLQLGDPTAASLALATVTAALPVCLSLGLVAQLRQGIRGTYPIFNTLAIVAALQWFAWLTVEGLVPFRLWL
ncbi:serine hydrolase domain-containing protein [Tahibacter amnicola]|uniref:Beta-lactamase family protein n=1 Tax=Tahibacter amnicola TaxID=2976241 RepID=A0ABY6BGL3_9GAMM|nr:serine hydrolase domain-containing protein [Tahibacter amnicola]UXI67002.1 beta-lactamase family protein [Tahibacter amnicola]